MSSASVRGVDRLAAPAAAEWRAERLRRLREHATRHSPWYRSHHRGLGAAPLRALPILTKAELVERFDELVTDRQLHLDDLGAVVTAPVGKRPAGRYRVGASSGSAGQPCLFPFDEAEWVGLIANSARARAVAGHPEVAGAVRTARIGSPSPWHLSRQVAATLHDPRKPSLTLSAASDVDELVTELGRYRPHVLTGYASVLVALADRQLAGQLAITPAQVLSGGERLTPAARERITEAWGSQPFDQYLTTEAGFVAIECSEHAGLHVMDDHVVVEVVDAAGEPVAPGDEGDRVLLTVLGSRTLPLVRYALEDVATIDPSPCPCGRPSPRLRSVAGAARALLRFPGRDGSEVEVHPVVVTSVLDAAPVGAWQVLHEAGRLRVLVVGWRSDAPADSVGLALQQSLTEAGVADVAVEVVPVDELRRTRAGKAALVVSDGA